MTDGRDLQHLLRGPETRLGVYKSFDDVPDRRRLESHATAYEGRDVWPEYRQRHDLSERMAEEWARFWDRWTDHMGDCDRHPALARPDDVEAWSGELLDRFSVDRSYQHWNVIEGFYEWLKWHTDHPHAYNPFHLAAAENTSNARQIWSRKMEKANA